MTCGVLENAWGSKFVSPQNVEMLPNNPAGPGRYRQLLWPTQPRPPKEKSAGWTYLSNRPGVCEYRVVITLPGESPTAKTQTQKRSRRLDISVQPPGSNPVLRNNAPGREIGHPGRVSAGI